MFNPRSRIVSCCLVPFALTLLACGDVQPENLPEQDPAELATVESALVAGVDAELEFGKSKTADLTALKRDAIYSFVATPGGTIRASVESIPNGTPMRVSLYAQSATAGYWYRVAHATGSPAVLTFSPTATAARDYVLVAGFNAWGTQTKLKVSLACASGTCGACPPVAPPPPCPGRLRSSGRSANGCGTPLVCETSCGGLQGLGCAPDAYCNYEDNSCGAADQLGTCEFKPDACILTVSAPVCGCDDRTYLSACDAAMAGVSVVAEGECAPSNPAEHACGSRGLPECGKGYWCKFSEAAQCGALDHGGVCTPESTGTVCTTEFDPVCGCDGKTYGNPCEATRANVSIAHKGACAKP